MSSGTEHIEKVKGGILVILEDGREALLEEQAVVKLAELTYAFQ